MNKHIIAISRVAFVVCNMEKLKQQKGVITKIGSYYLDIMVRLFIGDGLKVND